MFFSEVEILEEDKKEFFDRLDDIYKEMVKRYEIVSGALGFTCKDCDDNCCYTHFKHYTLIEYLYLMEGMSLLEDDVRADVVKSAKEVAKKTLLSEEMGEKIRILCPLNRNGLCIMYKHRLMICRLHGTAHYFDTPRGRVEGSGCYRFQDLCEGKRSVPMLDRTDLYGDLAKLEMDVRRKTGIESKFKSSIAEMIAGSF